SPSALSLTGKPTASRISEPTVPPRASSTRKTISPSCAAKSTANSTPRLRAGPRQKCFAVLLMVVIRTRPLSASRQLRRAFRIREVLAPNPPQLAQLIQSRFHPFDGGRISLRSTAPAQCLGRPARAQFPGTPPIPTRGIRSCRRLARPPDIFVDGRVGFPSSPSPHTRRGRLQRCD